MAGHTPWHEIKARKGPDTLERRAMREAFGRAMDDALRIAELREAAGASQGELAEVPEAAPVARRADLYLATLRDYVAALGGELRLAAVFPDQRIDLALPTPATGDERERPAPAALARSD